MSKKPICYAVIRGEIIETDLVEFGGRGGTLIQETIFQIEHARVRAPYWVGVNGRDLLGPMLLRNGTDAQKARFLPPIARAEEFWGQGFSEPNAGSDLASLRTRAERDGEGWVVNGQKIWMTLGNFADWMYVLCRTGTEESRHRGITMLLVDAENARHRPLAGRDRVLELPRLEVVEVKLHPIVAL